MLMSVVPDQNVLCIVNQATAFATLHARSSKAPKMTETER